MNKQQLRISRRWFICGATASCLLTGCGENKLAQTITDAYKLTFVDQKGPNISRDAVSKLPYASITAKIGKGPRGLLILWLRKADDLYWLSADNVVIVTRLGRVVKTSGVPEEIRDTHATQSDPVALGLHDESHLKTFKRQVDLKENQRNLQTLEIASEFSQIRHETLKIVEINFDTILVSEKCVAKTVNWQFENLYWVDPADGFVWKSTQHIARSFPPVVIEVCKPAA